MGQKPLIAITRSASRGRVMTWFNRLAVWRAGGRSIVATPKNGVDPDKIDGLVIGGGDDIDVSLYDAELEVTRRIDPERDELEYQLLKLARERELPVLGICRGAQILNVYRGGTLHTDIHEVFENAPRLRTVLPRKMVKLDSESRLRKLIGQAEAQVNALHHQSVAKTGRRLDIVAKDEHGIVQAIEDPKAPFVLGVQWHPEFLLSEGKQQNLFDALVGAARQRQVEKP